MSIELWLGLGGGGAAFLMLLILLWPRGRKRDHRRHLATNRNGFDRRIY